MFRRLGGAVFIAAVTLSTISMGLSSASAAPVASPPRVSLAQEQGDAGVLVALDAISDLFSCEHRPALPWCG